MKKRLVLGAILASLFSFSYAHKTYQVCFNYSINTFDLLGYSYTPGYYFDPTSIKISTGDHTGNNCLSVDSYNQLSTTPRDWVKQALLDSNIDWGYYNMVATGFNTNKNTPDELNFAINVNMTFINGSKLYNCNNIYLGQGYSLLNGDNWWLFTNINNEKPIDNHHTDCIITCTQAGNNQAESIAVGVLDFNKFSLSFKN